MTSNLELLKRLRDPDEMARFQAWCDANPSLADKPSVHTATWLYGPNSEAARAFRGEGSFAATCKALRWAAEAFMADANAAPMGATFHGGSLHGASVYNVNERAARKLGKLADSISEGKVHP